MIFQIKQLNLKFDKSDLAILIIMILIFLVIFFFQIKQLNLNFEK